MKILMVTRNFPLREASSGGIENYLKALCLELSKKNNITVISPSRDPHAPNYSLQISNQNHIKIIKIVRNYTSIRNILNDPLFFIRDGRIEAIIDGLIDMESPDIVHIHHLNDLSFGIVNIIKKKHIPMIITLHDLRLINTHTHMYSTKTYKLDPSSCKSYFPVFYRKKIGYSLAKIWGGLPAKILIYLIMLFRFMTGYSCNKIERLRINYAKKIIKQADLLLAPSSFVKKLFTPFADKDKIQVRELGVVPPKIKRDPLGKKVRFGYVGGFLKHKGINILLNAFTSIRTKNAHLFIYGDELKDVSVQKLIMKYSGNKNITFMGMYKDSGKLFSNIDVLIVPSICDETFSLAAHEAFAAKIPVIASKCGAFTEYIRNNINGFLFNPADEKDLRNILIKIANNPGIINKIRKNIPNVLTISDDASQLTAIYNKVRAKR